jgi:predicted nucleic acid-binding protein
VAVRGRPPLSRGVLAFDTPEWQPPKAVLLDTNVVAEALLANQPEHTACLAVLERLGAEGTTVMFSRLLEIELWEVAFNLALRERHPRKDVRRMRYDNRVRPRAARLLDQAHKAWEKMLASLTWSRVEIHDVASEVPRLMQDYGLQSYDAVHAATLMASKASDFVTRDGGFAALPPDIATLHTTQVRLAGTRARRRRMGH